MKKFLYFVFAALLGGAVALGGAQLLGWGQPAVVTSVPQAKPVKFTNYNNPATVDLAIVNEGFSRAADQTLPAVVHIRATLHETGEGLAQAPFDLRNLPEPFRDFFGNPDLRGQMPPDQPRVGSGSGVIISPDGYIVTNNHVVQDADELEVTLNDQRVYQASVIGTDPSTDIALVKIGEQGLSFLKFANSDGVKVGEWVLAVGNPFNLASTVTAGIVSAKGRNINILEDQAPIESFIQTDAAVNPGNSGGALVNIDGDLIGINSAIASPTGVYAGYAFAVPSNIVAKVIADLKEFGVVQRGYLGAMIRSIDGHFAKEKGLKTSSGVYVDSLTANSAAAAAGIRVGDVILRVDDVATSTSPELLEQIGRHRPGDKITITVNRQGKEKNFEVVLKNRAGNTDIVKKEDAAAILNTLGAEFATLGDVEKEQLHLDGGVRIVRLHAGKLRSQTNIREGFIITRVDNRPVRNTEDLARALNGKNGGVMLEGIYPGSDEVYYYAFGVS